MGHKRTWDNLPDAKLPSDVPSTKDTAGPKKEAPDTMTAKKAVTGATISLTTTAMGSGWLTLPKAFGIYGLASGSFMMTMAAMNAFIALNIFARMMRKNKNCENYAQLVETTLGNKSKIICNFVFALNLFGTLIAYGLVINKLFLHVFEGPLANLFGYEDNDNFHQVISLSFFMFICIITLPLQF